MSSTEHHPDPVTDVDRPVAGSIGEYDDRPPPPPAAAGWPRDDTDVERRPVDYDDVASPENESFGARDDTDVTGFEHEHEHEQEQEPETEPTDAERTGIDGDHESPSFGDDVAGSPSADVVGRNGDAGVDPEPGFRSGSEPVGEATDAALIDDPEHVRLRWQTVQVGFVDDPRGAIDDAGKLVDEVVDLVVTGVAAQRDRLGESWSADDLDTEQLRLALRSYREFLDRLLAV